jgi:hypothetical protein
MHDAVINLSSAQLRRAAEIKEQIDDLQAELSELLSRSLSSSRLGRPRGSRMSAAGRAAISAAAKARWAKFRTKSSTQSANSSGRKMSPAAKARLSAVAKARWKKAKAAGKAAL